MLVMLLLPLRAVNSLELEKLLMPGPLADAHAEIEAECTSCHSRFRKTDQSQLCLDCHEGIAEDLQLKQGFHSRSPRVAGAACFSCHTDHEGRNADIVGLDESRFDHRLTDFTLQGGHSDVGCNDCHRPDLSYREAPHGCNDCHLDDDPHESLLGQDCASCHTVANWDEVNFDHNSTEFVLRGEHRQTACLDCHADQTFQNTPDDCNACHSDDDPHQGELGSQCQDCHGESDWSTVSFDHDSTRFTLLGKHQGAQCGDCHQDQTFQNTPLDCYSCHLQDDVHEGRNGQDCQQCHGESDWTETSFNHQRDTRFILDGSHKRLKCVDCHSEDPFADNLESSCLSCHQQDDVHEGSNGAECEDCHTTQNWQESNFDHNLQTEFIIRGKHRELDCNDCHAGNVYATSLEGSCESCHRQDDPHEGQQGEACGDCHNETDWNLVEEFDHDFARFPLLGQHTDLQCSDCHESAAFRQAPADCYSCHVEDDYHKEKFGRSCDSCHNPVAWDIWFFDHNEQTDFILDGAHQPLSCDSCHTQSGRQSMDLPQRCDACHQQDDIHDGEFGARCDRCHTTESFLDLTEIE